MVLIEGAKLDALVCPFDKASLSGVAGELVCSNGHKFPLIGRVPSFLPDARDPVRSSFSREWATFDYEKDRTWGVTAEERRRRFPGQVNLSPEDLAGKLVLDAGCGNGALSNELTKFGCDVVAADISSSVRAAAIRFAGNERIQFVEADLMHPPFRPGTFDVVFSGGVLHHTPDTRHAFEQLVSTVAPGGTFYVWLYRPVTGRLLAAKLKVRDVVSRLPARLRYAVVLILLPQAMLRHYWHVLRGQEQRLALRERLVALLVSLTPRYRWVHTPEEVHDWFEELGFVEITNTDQGTWGFGVAARRPAAAKG